MNRLNLSLIRSNIFKLLEFSGLTDIEFANILDISEKQLRLIKKEQATFNDENINKACSFFIISFNKLNTTEIEIKDNYRISLLQRHKNNPEFYKVLESTPSLTFAIKYLLLRNQNFKQHGFSTREIKIFLAAQGWHYTSRYISLGMARNKDLIEIAGTKIEGGKEINIYRARQSK